MVAPTRAPYPMRALPRAADSGKIRKFASGLYHDALHPESTLNECMQSAKAGRFVLIQFVSVGGMRAGPVPGKRSVLFLRLIEGAC